MNQLIITLAVLLTTSSYGQNYSVEDSMTQTLNAAKVNYLIIECYCNNGVEVKETQSKIIQIAIKGKLESIGYHGKQETPNGIRSQTLSFNTEVRNDTLRLVSKEWTHIHHSYLIDELKIQIPQGIKYKIIKVPGKQLEGRKVK